MSNVFVLFYVIGENEHIIGLYNDKNIAIKEMFNQIYEYYTDPTTDMVLYEYTINSNTRVLIETSPQLSGY
jgi:hypothetical protein